LRGVPAQFTDIVTSIAGGQKPLTVFLQQGGQLKDMFGGAGNAARALGGYVVGLINPFTLAAAAAGALGVAYYQGSKEADALARAIIMTGNAAGASVGQLQDMARAVCCWHRCHPRRRQ
jgi:phage-related minor tail protein